MSENDTATDVDASQAADARHGGSRSLFTIDRLFFESLFILVLMAYVGYILFVTRGYNERAQLVPLTIGIPTAILLIVLLGRQLYTARVGDEDETDDPEDGEPVDDSAYVEDESTERTGSATPTSNRKIIRANKPLVQAVLWVALLFGLIMTVGILFGGLVFLVAFYRLQANLSWPWIVLYTGIVTLFLWFVFLYTLNVPIGEGILFSLL